MGSGYRTPSTPFRPAASIPRPRPACRAALVGPAPLSHGPVPRAACRYASARIAVSKSRRARATRADCMPAASSRARSAVRSASTRSPVRR